MTDTWFGERDNVEEGLQLQPKFDGDGLIPAIASDVETGEILMVAYMNEEAFKRTIEIGEAVFFSRSRQELWHKGATSGHTLKVDELLVDCDQDTVWLKVQAIGGAACHVGYRSCFYRRVPLKPGGEATGPLALELTAEKVFDPDAVYGS